MGKWEEIQYLIYLNEISCAKRREVVTYLKNNAYGKGYVRYAKKYFLLYSEIIKKNAF